MKSGACSLDDVGDSQLRVAGLFAGIGGIELGLERAGLAAELLCEWWTPAQTVLTTRFPDANLVGDVREIEALPSVDLVTAGFPCTDLSQAGRMKGISGEASGLVGEVFRLVAASSAPHLLLENVRNMLVLDKGQAMRFLVTELERLDYQWAYRLVDSRFTGVPQRRQRVIFFASRTLDPRAVLFADNVEPPDDNDWYTNEACGFSWTEGLRGVGWAKDATPTLKGGSTVGIASPPAIWNPSAALGRRIVTPSIEDAEALQGFPREWTRPAEAVTARKGDRWKLVGNAVTVGVSKWVGQRIVRPGAGGPEGKPVGPEDRWPKAAYGGGGDVWAVDVSMWPKRLKYRHLDEVVKLASAAPLSHRATAGFHSRALRSTLNFKPGFLDAIAEHERFMKRAAAA